MPKQKYRVLNPRGIPRGIRILMLSDRVERFEGDEFAPATTIPQADIDDLVARGFLEVANG